VGANPNRPGWEGRRRPYSHESQFHEPFVLFGFLAAVNTMGAGLKSPQQHIEALREVKEALAS
jgi:hypothetical protein